MVDDKKKSSDVCDCCEFFLRMYKGAGVGTCRRGSNKYRSEDSNCDLIENVEEGEVESISSGLDCHRCGGDILELELSKEHSIGSFDSSGQIVHYFCSECWNFIDYERENVRRQFNLE
jgi:hypothetical protein